MNTSSVVIVFFSQSNQFIVFTGGGFLTSVFEEFMKSHWHEWQKLDDPGQVINVTVKQGIGADHAKELKLLNGVHDDGNG